MSILDDITKYRSTPSQGYNPHRFLELFGGTIVPIYNYEPDPQTSRNPYYYNSRTNQLFKRMSIIGDTEYAYWLAVSENS